MQANPSFQPGDTVQLKSGGPTMTVKSINYRQNLMCQWFDGTSLKEAEFLSLSLQIAPEDGLPIAPLEEDLE